METIKRDKAGYTILIKDKYILCGTSRDSYFKEIDKLGVSNPRQYKSLKIVFNNIGYHIENNYNCREFYSELSEELITAGYWKMSYWGNKKVPDYSTEGIKHLIKKGLVKIVKISQILSLEEVTV